MSGAHFSIVGIFSSHEAAKSAAVILDDALKAIAEWHINHRKESETIFEEWVGLEPIITPVEEDLKREYGIEWELPILIRDAYDLSTYGNFLFLKNKWSTRTGAYPIDRFIERLGGTALVSGDYINTPTWGELKITILCTALNEQVAQELVTMFQGSVNFLIVTIEIEETYDGKSIKRFSESIPEIMEYIKKAGCRDIRVISTQRRNYYVNWDK